MRKWILAIAALLGISLMLAWKPDVWRPDVPEFMGSWGPAHEHSLRMNHVCSDGDPAESGLGCIWGSTIGGLWVLLEYLVVGFIALTHLPAIMIGFALGCVPIIIGEKIFTS